MTLPKNTYLFKAQSVVCRIAAGNLMIRMFICIFVCLSLLLTLKSGALAAGFCTTPAKDGVGTPSGTVNTYYPVTTSVSKGATSITLGASSGAVTGITAGDMLLVIQMQDADINQTNSSVYGDGLTGAGYTNNNQTGLYEYVKATNTVGTGGGTVNLSTGLVNNYRYRTASTTNGASTFQVIRVPQYSTATVSGTLRALFWNGRVGGVIAIDVADLLTVTGTITADGAGFRGGWGESGGNGSSGANTDYITRSTSTGNGMKGEGTAGTPNRMNQPASWNGTPNQVTAGSLGYPGTIGGAAYSDASKGRGAPGNGGGGSTDGNVNNDQNSGGGGGGNYGPGGKGGNSWNSNLSVGGEGGGATGVSFSKLFMGGGGGAGTTNNSTNDTATYSNPAGLSCNAGAACSSGSTGGGIVILRAQSITGGGNIYARGSTSYNVLNDSAGGGGAGGSVIIETKLGGTASANVSGGDGGNAWRNYSNNNADRHGPGGGGSGGFIAYAPATLAITPTYTGGLNGITTNNSSYGSTGSVGGTYAYQIPPDPGSEPGYNCRAKLGKSYDLTTIGIGSSSTLTFTITNSIGNPAQSGLAFTDTFPAGLTVTGISSTTGCGGTTSYSASTVTLASGALSAGTSSCTFTATVRGDTAGSYINNSTRFSGLGGLLDTSEAAATVNVRRVALTKSYDSANISIGGSSTLTFTLTNASGNPAQTNLTFTDTLTTGSGLTVTGVTALAGSGCSATMPTFNATGNPSVTLSGATMAQAATVCTFTATVQGNSAGTYDNLTANISGAAAVIDTSGVNSTLTVIGTPPPSSGNKPLYLYDSTSSPGYKLSRTPMAVAAGAYVSIPRGNNTRSWTLNPVLAADVTISSGNFMASLWLATNNNRTYTIPVTLFCGATTVATVTQDATLDATVRQFTFTLPLALAYTCPKDSTFSLSVTNTRGTGTTASDIRVYPAPSTGNYSKVTLASQSVINVGSIALYDGAYPGGSTIAAASTGSTVYIRSVISDPFGNYDINANPPTTRPTITIKDKNGLTIVPATAMTELGALTTAGTKTFEYAYTVPGSPVGNWLLQVNAVEGTEANVSHFRQAIMPVYFPLPLISILKFADKKTVNPGEIIVYTVQISNSGTGAGTNVVLKDDLSPYGSFRINSYSGAPFYYTDTSGSPASGLTLGVPEYIHNNNGVWVTTLTDGGGSAPAGYDGTVTNWRIPMGGTLRPGGSFILNYQIIVK